MLHLLNKALADFSSNLLDEHRNKFISGGGLGQLSGKFYVYVLMRPDGSVFYIGKGQRSRISNHENEARKGVQSLKCDIIREIWSKGGQVIRQKIAFFDKEEDAFALEMLLIDFFGRENLANEACGGQGGVRPGSGRPRRVAQVPMSREELKTFRKACELQEERILTNSEVEERLQSLFRRAVQVFINGDQWKANGFH